jgi:hypothetical protein
MQSAPRRAHGDSLTVIKRACQVACGLVALWLAPGLGLVPVASAATPSPPFTQCPPIGADASCGSLIVVHPDRSVSVYSDPSTGPYDGADDTLVGIENLSSQSVPAITAYGPNGSGLFGFDRDGICTYSFAGNEYCSHLPTGATTYEGPGTSFITDPKTTSDGEVDFAGSTLAPGAHTYFSLEGAVTSATLAVRLGHLVQAFHMVVMGDSYSSGEGTYNAHDNSVDYYSDSATASDTCHRSRGGYGPLLGVAGDQQSQPQDVLACSGATIAQIENGKSNEQGQVKTLASKALTSPVTTVALTASGDSLGFTNVLSACTNEIPGVPHFGVPVLEALCAKKIGEELKHLTTTMDELYTLLTKIEATTTTSSSQGATIFLLDYPHLFPNGGHEGCNHIPPGSQVLLNQAADTLDGEIERVADELPYVQFVEVRHLFEGHAVCGDSAPYINDLQLNVGPFTNCPNNYLATHFPGGGVCSQSYHPDTAGWAAESGLVREKISQYQALTTGSSCVSKMRPATGIGPGVAGDYRLGDNGLSVAPTEGPTSSPGPFAPLGGIYADELNCSPWVDPGGEVTAGIMLQQFNNGASNIQTGWAETSGGTRTTLVELRDPVTEALARFGIHNYTYERCDEPSSLLHGSLTLQCPASTPIYPYLPLPPTDISSFYTIEFHPFTSPITRTFTVPHLFVKPFDSPPIGCHLEYAVFYRCEQPYVEYGDFKIFLAQPGTSARTEIAQAPARFIPNQANVLGETRNQFDQMAGTATVPEVFDETHVYDDGGWVGFGGSYTYNGLPLDGLNIDYSNALSGSSDPLGSSGQRVEIWDQRIP